MWATKSDRSDMLKMCNWFAAFFYDFDIFLLKNGRPFHFQIKKHGYKEPNKLLLMWVIENFRALKTLPNVITLDMNINDHAHSTVTQNLVFHPENCSCAALLVIWTGLFLNQSKTSKTDIHPNSVRQIVCA